MLLSSLSTYLILSPTRVSAIGCPASWEQPLQDRRLYLFLFCVLVTVLGEQPLCSFLSSSPPFPHSPVCESACRIIVSSYLDFTASFSPGTSAKQVSATPRPLKVPRFHHRIPVSRPTGLNEVRDTARYSTIHIHRVKNLHLHFESSVADIAWERNQTERKNKIIKKHF